MRNEEEVSLKPGPNADSEDEIRKHIDSNVLNLYDATAIDMLLQ